MVKTRTKHAESYIENSHVKDILLGALAGGVLGGAALLLLAPKSGRDLRQDIYDMYGDVSDKVHEMTGVGCDEEECSEDGIISNHMNLLAGAIAGGLLGVAAALLLAPKSGAALRRNFGHTYDTLADKTRQFASSVGGMGHLFKGKGRSKGVSGDWMKNAQGMVETLAHAIGSVKETVGHGRKEAASSLKSFEDILEWASLGLRALQNIKRR